MTAAAIPDAIRPRLGQFVRLLASDQPGEVVAAAAALRRALGGVGADLHDLAEVIERPAERIVIFNDPPAPRKRKAPRKPQPGDVVLDAATRRSVGKALWRAVAGGCLTEWETEFATSLAEQMGSGSGRITKKQGDALGRLLAKVGESAAWA